MPLDLPAETRAEAVASVQSFFRDERDEEVGALAAGVLLDHVLAEVGPVLYNRGVADAQARVHAQVATLEVDLYETPFPLSRRR